MSTVLREDQNSSLLFGSPGMREIIIATVTLKKNASGMYLRARKAFHTSGMCRCAGFERTSERNLVELPEGTRNVMIRAKSRSIHGILPRRRVPRKKGFKVTPRGSFRLTPMIVPSTFSRHGLAISRLAPFFNFLRGTEKLALFTRPFLFIRIVRVYDHSYRRVRFEFMKNVTRLLSIFF